MQTHLDRVRSLAATQHGVISANQIRDLGMTRDERDNHVEHGGLVWITRRVLAVGGAPCTPLRELTAAVLDTGRHAAISHTTALSHWGVRGFIPDPVHVIRRRDVEDHPVGGVVLHEVRYLPKAEIKVLDGVRLVSPALALLQLAGTSCSTTRLALAIDAAWSDRLVHFGTLTAIDASMSRQGRRGLTRFRALVDERGPAYVPPASNLEARFAHILERAGRRPMQRQVDTFDEDGWIGRVDFRDHPLPVIAEIQSERFHRGLTAEASDAERIGRLRAAGFEVVEITDVDVFQRPTKVLAVIDAARARAQARTAETNPTSSGPGLALRATLVPGQNSSGLGAGWGNGRR